MAAAVRFTLNEDDMVRAARLFALASMRRRKTLVSFAVLFVVLLTIMSLLAGVIFPFSAERLAQNWPIILGASLFPFVVVSLLGFVLGPTMSRRVYRQQRSLHGAVGLAWTAERLEFDSEYGQFAMPWSHFVRWAEDRHTFVLFESDRLYRVIPKRVLDAETERSLREGLAAIGTLRV